MRYPNWQRTATQNRCVESSNLSRTNKIFFLILIKGLTFETINQDFLDVLVDKEKHSLRGTGPRQFEEATHNGSQSVQLTTVPSIMERGGSPHQTLITSSVPRLGMGHGAIPWRSTLFDYW